MMNKKVLILGAQGMLGCDLVEAFFDYDLIAWDKDELNITNFDLVSKKISELKPQIIINATGYTDVDGAEKNKESANQINGEAVGQITKTAKQINAVFVHFSTEYVFDGQNQAGYDEKSKPAPINAYGKSKALGEQLLQKNCQNYYLIRSSWLYGQHAQRGKPRGMNFVETMLKLSQEQNEVKVVDDQFGSPTYTVDLTQATRQLVASQKPFGIYHLVNETKKGGVSWYEFAKKIFDLKNISVNLTAILSNQYPQKAQRPKQGVLLNTKFDKLRNWDQALKDYLKT